MSTQLLFGRGTSITNSSIAAPLSTNWIAGGFNIAQPMPAAGTIGNFSVKLFVAPGGVTSRTFTVQKNGTNTSLVVTITGAATTNADTTHTVSYAAGDTIGYVATQSGSPAASGFEAAMEFTPTTANVSVYGWESNQLTTNGFCAPLQGLGFGIAQFAGTHVVAAPGTFTAWYWVLLTAPGAGTSRTGTIYKNNVAQDGTGGTPDTRVTIADTAKTGNASFSLTVAAGDQITIKQTISGSPASSTVNAGTIAFTATHAGAFQVCSVTTGASTSTKYNQACGQAVAESTTESTVELGGSVTNLTIGGMYVVASAAPGASKSWTYTLRKNGADTGLAVTISGASQTANNAAVAPITIAAADTWAIKVTNVGSPGSLTADRQIGLLNGTVGGPVSGFNALLIAP